MVRRLLNTVKTVLRGRSRDQKSRLLKLGQVISQCRMVMSEMVVKVQVTMLYIYSTWGKLFTLFEGPSC